MLKFIPLIALKLSLLTVMLSLHTSIKGQSTDSIFLTVPELIAKGIEQYHQEEWEKSLSYLRQVPFGDSLYFTMGTTVVELLSRTGEVDKAIEHAKYLQQYPSNVRSVFYRQQISLLLSKRELVSADALIDSCIQAWPMNFYFHTLKATSLIEQEEYRKAVDVLYLAIGLNPTNVTNFLLLGRSLEASGNLTLAAMAYGKGLSMETNNRNLLIAMRDLCKGGGIAPPATRADRQNPFTETDRLIRSRVALNSRQRMLRLDTDITKQWNLIFETLDMKATSDNVLLQWLISFYQTTKAEGYEDVFTANIQSIIEEKFYNSWINRNRAKYNQFAQLFEKSLTDALLSKSYLDFKDVPAGTEVHFNNLATPSAIGELRNDKKFGNWVYFAGNYEVSAYGAYYDNVEIGTWTYFNRDGSKDYITLRSGDTLSFTVFNRFGFPTVRSQQADGKQFGLREEFYNCGLLSQTSHYTDGELHGMRTFYFADGKTRSTSVFEHGKRIDTLKQWFDCGSISSIEVYQDDLLNGPGKFYYKNGQLRAEGSFINDEQTGLWNYYYDNGAIRQVGEFHEGNRVGLWKSYNRDESSQDYIHFDSTGLHHGTYTSFYRDGSIRVEFEYEHDKLLSVINYKRDGSIISEHGSDDGTFDYNLYYECGRKRLTGKLKGGQLNGPFTLFHSNGKVQKVEPYRDGALNGIVQEFYSDGSLSTESKFENGIRTGWYKQYNLDGDLFLYGLFMDGERDGTWIRLSNDGSVLATKSFYQNGSLQGYFEFFDSEGKILYQSDHFGGIRRSIRYFNAAGESTFYHRFNIDSDTLEKKYLNGNTLQYEPLFCGFTHGTSKYFFPNGSPEIETEFKNGNRHGVRTVYFSNGSPKNTANYIDDELNGVNNWYSPDGSKVLESTYKDGYMEGIYRYYFHNGTIEIEGYREDGEIMGLHQRYNYEGDLMCEKEFGESGTIAYRSPGGEWIDFDYNRNLETFFEDGTPASTEDYSDGVLHGARTFYYKNGSVFLVQSHSKDRLHGEFRQYYPNGNLMETGNYYYGSRHGTWMYYHEDGTKKMEENYYFGDTNGRVVIYDENEMPEYEVIYRRGYIEVSSAGN